MQMKVIPGPGVLQNNYQYNCFPLALSLSHTNRLLLHIHSRMANVSLASEIRANMHIYTHTRDVITESEAGSRPWLHFVVQRGGLTFAALLARACLVSLYYVVVGALFGRRDGRSGGLDWPRAQYSDHVNFRGDSGKCSTRVANTAPGSTTAPMWLRKSSSCSAGSRPTRSRNCSGTSSTPARSRRCTSRKT